MSNTGTSGRITGRFVERRFSTALKASRGQFCSEEILQGKGTDFLFIEGSGIQREGGLYNDNDGREYPEPCLILLCACVDAFR